LYYVAYDGAPLLRVPVCVSRALLVIHAVLQPILFLNNNGWLAWQLLGGNIQGGPKKRHKVYGIIILQSYITESYGFQQNVLKEILYMTKVSV